MDDPVASPKDYVRQIEKQLCGLKIDAVGKTSDNAS